MLAGGTLRFDGIAGGSYLGAGRDLTVSGELGGSVRAAAFSIDLDATVARNVTLAGERVTVGEGTTIGGNAYLAGNRVRFSGFAAGDVVASGGDVVVDGEIEGDLQIEANEVTIEPDAVIRGEVRYRIRRENEPVVAPGATVDGGLVPLAAMEKSDGAGIGSLVFKVLAFVLTALVLVVLFPKSAADAAEKMKNRPTAALVRGVLWLFLAPVLVIVLAITVVGIPLALILAAAYGAFFYVAPIVPALWVGDRLASRPQAAGASRVLLPTAVGATVVALALLLPWIGFFARIVLTCAGMGGIALLIGARRGMPAR
jgi:cytoskeletal protein CcmA (bactofilin family)